MARVQNDGRVMFCWREYVAIGIPMILAIAGVIVSYTTLRVNAQTQEEVIEKHEAGLIKLEERNDEQDKDIVSIKSDVEHIKDNVDDMKEDQKEQMTMMVEQKIMLESVLHKLNQ